MLIVFFGVQKSCSKLMIFVSFSIDKIIIPALSLSLSSHLTSCTSTTSNFYLANSLAAPFTFTPLEIAVTLCVIPRVCVQVQVLKYYVNLYPGVCVARFLIKVKINFFKAGFTLTTCTSSYISKRPAFCNRVLCASLTKQHSRNDGLRLEIQLQVA